MKRHTSFFLFLFSDLKLVLVDSAFNSASGNLTQFFFKNVGAGPRKAAKLENPGKNFSEMSFVIYSRKTGKFWNQNFSDRKLTGIVWMK